MCPNHHTVIDNDEEAYTVERLRTIKTAHEAQSAQMPDAEAAAAAETYIKSVANVAQSGGLSAHTVNAGTITVQSAPSTSHLTHQRQIQAVEHLWQVVRKLSSEFSGVVLVDTILTPSELVAYFAEGKSAQLGQFILEYADMNVALRKSVDAGANDADNERPFVTNRLWSIFFVLRALYGRTALLLSNSYRKRTFIDWRTDGGCDQLLRAILPEQTVERAKGQVIGGLRTAIDCLEGEFLTEAGMNKSHV